MKNEVNIFDKLLEVPLFKGMNHSELSEVVAHIKFGFHKYTEGKTIIKDGDTCDYLCFLTNGRMKVMTDSNDHSYTFVEEITAPSVIQAERIYGLVPRFTSTFISKTTCNVITIDKVEMMKLLNDYEIFRFNIINMIFTQLQRHERMLWREHPNGLQLRIIRFLTMRCIHPAGEKTVYMRMTILAKELNTNRLRISKALNELQAQGLITLQRGVIYIPAVENLIKYNTELKMNTKQ